MRASWRVSTMMSVPLQSLKKPKWARPAPDHNVRNVSWYEHDDQMYQTGQHNKSVAKD